MRVRFGALCLAVVVIGAASVPAAWAIAPGLPGGNRRARVSVEAT
jgi:hypothetical protein